MKQFILILSFFPVFVFGQKIDLDHSYTNSHLTYLPETVLAPDVTTYAFQLTGMSNITNWGFNQEQIIKQYSNLQGFKKVTPEEADLIWTIDVSPIQFNGADIKNSSTTTKDKTGRETTTYTYWYEMYYFKHFSAKVVNRKGEVIHTYTDGTEGQRLVIKSDSKTTYKEAQDAYNKDAQQSQANVARSSIENGLQYILSSVNHKLGYQQSEVSFNLYITDSPKHPENIAFVKNLKETQRLFAAIPAHQLPDSLVKGLEKAVDYFNSVAIKYTSTEKTDVKLRYASYYNIAQIYLYLDRFDESTEAAKKLIANDYDKKDGEKMIKANIAIKEGLAKAGQKSRHFERLKTKTVATKDPFEDKTKEK